MSSPAYVIGLPRSRTYWLSELINAHKLTTGFHELARTATSREDYVAKLTGVKESTIAVDCGSMPIEILEGSKVVQVIRDNRAVVSSMNKLPCFEFMEREGLKQRVDNLRNYHKMLLLTVHYSNLYLIKYSDLNDCTKVFKLLQHLGIVPDFNLIESYQSRVLTAPYIDSATPSDMEKYGELLHQRYF